MFTFSWTREEQYEQLEREWEEARLQLELERRWKEDCELPS